MMQVTYHSPDWHFRKPWWLIAACRIVSDTYFESSSSERVADLGQQIPAGRCYLICIKQGTQETLWVGSVQQTVFVCRTSQHVAKLQLLGKYRSLMQGA